MSARMPATSGCSSSTCEAEYGVCAQCYGQSLAVNTQFIEEVGPLLAALPYLQRFAWFTNRPYPGGYEQTNLLDTSGTGGGASSFNVSTTAALIAASLGRKS